MTELNDFLFRIAKRIWPDLETLSSEGQVVGTGNVIAVLYGTPLVLISIFWLIRWTDLTLFEREWINLILLAFLYTIFQQVSFFFISEIHPGRYANADNALGGVVVWSSLLLFGPTVLWVPFGAELVRFGFSMRSASKTTERWQRTRVSTLNLASNVFALLVAVGFYQRLGGQFPIKGLMIQDILPAFGAILAHFLLVVLIFSGYLGHVVRGQKKLNPELKIRPVLGFVMLALGLPYLANPFGILTAGVYIQNNLISYLFFNSGIFMVAVLARKFSHAAESSRQQSRQLQQLEQLSRAIINGPPDASTLPDILNEYVPSMFPSGRTLIWLNPDQYLFRNPREWNPNVEQIWDWVQTHKEICAFQAKDQAFWQEEHTTHSPFIVAPILEVETNDAIGGIYIELQSLVQQWNTNTMANLFPAVNAIAAQVASAINQADVYAEALELQRTSEELRLAGEIQATFFPDHIPVKQGWKLAVTILPVRETSGDFFDFIPLENGKIGILIADVTDKGVGPALYMALSRTLIRTYTIEYEFEPDIVFFATNSRILKDARANLFVTAFLGILDWNTGELSYSNAGHNPPYLLRCKGGKVEHLSVTGMPIGIEENAVWGKETVHIQPGDILLLYTDGIPDTQNEHGDYFEVEKLIEVTQQGVGLDAHQIQAMIVDEVQRFMNGTPQQDDITLMVLVREE